MLRALAVLTVVVYHLHPAWLTGGFVGVDVFFVISGFLITSHIIRELESTGRLSLRTFWANRARRILPAALLTIAVTSLAATVLIPLPQLDTLSTQALAAVFYVQNFALANQSVDYLAADSAATPFEHFWSLSVEEQFYLFWPLLAIAAMWVTTRVVALVHCRRGRTHLPSSTHLFRVCVALLFGAVVVASYLYSVKLVGAHDPKAYFVTGTRVWELGVGGLLACVAVDTRRFPVARTLVMFGGVGAIVWACVTYTGSNPAFPGAAALVPVLGTAAVIAAGQPVKLVAPIVNFTPLQWVGNWSYSLYLWHFPVITVVVARTGDDANTPAKFAGVFAVSLALAVLSYYLVEQPLRLKWKKRPLLVLGAAATAMAVGAGVAIVPQTVFNVVNNEQAVAAQAVQSKGYKGFGGGSLTQAGITTFVDNTKAIVPQPTEAKKDVPLYPGCVRVPSEAKDTWTPECTVENTSGSKTLVVVGDSHASQWVPALEEVYKDTDWKIVTLLHNACPFSLAQRGFEKYGELRCTGPNKDSLKKILDMKPDRVIISNRAVEDYDKQEGEQYPGENGFEKAFKPLKDAGLWVSVISPTPERGTKEAVPDCVALNMSNPNACAVEAKSATIDQDTTNAMRQAAADSGVEWIDMTSSFCHEDECPVVVGSVLVYRDDNHITATYMRTIAGNLARALGVKSGNQH